MTDQEREIAEEFEPEGDGNELEDPAPAERIAEFELALDSLGAAVDAANDRLKEVERLEARITHLEARTRDATINADIVSLQGKVTGLEANVGAVHAPALEELRTRVDALEART